MIITVPILCPLYRSVEYQTRKDELSHRTICWILVIGVVVNATVLILLTVGFSRNGKYVSREPTL